MKPLYTFKPHLVLFLLIFSIVFFTLGMGALAIWLISSGWIFSGVFVTSLLLSTLAFLAIVC